MKRKKVKLFDEGGSTNRRTRELLESDEELNPDVTERLRRASSGSNIKRMDGEGGYTSPRKISFGEEFAAARRSGKKTFEFDGKKFSTELRSEKKGGGSKVTSEPPVIVKKEDLGSQDFSPRVSERSDGASGAAIPIALGGAGATAALAKMMMGKPSSTSARTEPTLSAKGSARGMPGGSLRDPYAMNLGADLDPRTTLRMNPRMGIDSQGVEFKKGGKVKKMASGGKVSSASARADGIAQRGKTKGRIL
jgi:hypothetical protein